jgi:uncharacterized protein (TIGR03084 family)
MATHLAGNIAMTTPTETPRALDDADEHQLLHQQINDLRAEREELAELISTFPRDIWSCPTTFRDWTVWDVIAHLHLSDHMGMVSLSGETPFRALMRDMRDARMPMAAYARRWLGAIEGEALRDRWYALLGSLCDGLAATDPATRLPWAGPSMKPRMFATARQMETWAHGWELWDLTDRVRPATDRLRNVATIGVRTFGWTFANRGQEAPGAPPKVTLRAPSGAVWTWNEDNTQDHVSGDAVSFCQVVTQVRHHADTALRIEGPVAAAWMAIAQCFAGPPADPPAPGSRVPAY